jgi:hypothetical protein
VLRPGGIAVFCEPWGENPLLEWARRQLPYPGKGRTPGERPLRLRDVRCLQRLFPRVEMQGFQLPSMADLQQGDVLDLHGGLDAGRRRAIPDEQCPRDGGSGQR